MAISTRSAAFRRFQFPPDIIVLAVRWYLRYNLSYRDLEELLAERGVEVDHATLQRWVQRFTPMLITAARSRRRPVGERWHIDETYLRIRGVWQYLYRAIDGQGQVVDAYLSPRRDLHAARSFFLKAKIVTGGTPTEAVTDRAPAYPRVIHELCPGATHERRKHANNPVECDHGRLKARLRPMRGLKRATTTSTVVDGHAFIQNIRRGFYQPHPDDIRPALRVKHVFSSLLLAA